tara:strand:+ start:565 stop:795 length:231 start_codon:yes stop_codon:yes gene_type:complete
MDTRDEDNYINTVLDLDLFINEVRNIRTRIIFGELIDDLSDDGEFTEISLLLTKAGTYSQLAEIELRQALNLIEEK